MRRDVCHSGLIDMSEDHCTVVRDDRVECTCGWHSPRVLRDPRSLASWHRRAIRETIDNPLLHAFLAPITDTDLAPLGPHASEYFATSVRRNQLVTTYAWEIPTESVLRKIATLNRLYTLVGKTAGRASAALERGEELVALREALMAQASGRSTERRRRSRA